MWKALVPICIMVCYVAKAQFPYMNYMHLQDETPVAKVITSTTSDGGIIMATLQNGKCGVTRLDQTGVVIWAKVVEYPANITINNVYTVAEIEDGPGFYILTTSNSVPFQCQASGYILTEFNNLHQVTFSKFYCHYYGSCGGSSLPDHHGEAHRTSDGQYYLSLPTNPNYTCLFGVEQNGDTLYCRMYSDVPNSGGSYAGAESLLLNDGSVLLLNRTQGGIHLMRVQPDGELIWAKTYSINYWMSEATSAIQSPDGSIILSGIHWLSSYEHWGFLLRIDLSGNVTLNRRFDLADADGIHAGFPVEITLAPSEEIIVHLDRINDRSFLARFDPNGHLQYVGRLDDNQIMYADDHYYKSVWPKYTTDGLLSVTSAVEYLGDPWWNDSILVAGVNQLEDLCHLVSTPFFDEDDPNEIQISDNGSYRGSIWFRTGDIPVVLSDQQWIIEPFCLNTALSEFDNDIVMWIQPSLIMQGSRVNIRSSKLIEGDLEIRDTYGRLMSISKMIGEHYSIETGNLNSGLYSVVLNTTRGSLNVGKFMILN